MIANMSQREHSNNTREMKIEHITYDACHSSRTQVEPPLAPLKRISTGEKVKEYFRRSSLTSPTNLEAERPASVKSTATLWPAPQNISATLSPTIPTPYPSQKSREEMQKYNKDIPQSKSTKIPASVTFAPQEKRSDMVHSRNGSPRRHPVLAKEYGRSKDTSHPLRHKSNFGEKMIDRFFGQKPSKEDSHGRGEKKSSEGQQNNRGHHMKTIQERHGAQQWKSENAVLPNVETRSGQYPKQHSMEKIQRHREAIRRGKLERVVAPTSEIRAKQHASPPRPQGTLDTPRTSLDHSSGKASRDSKRGSNSTRSVGYLESGTDALFDQRRKMAETHLQAPQPTSSHDRPLSKTSRSSNHSSTSGILADLMSIGIDAVDDRRREVTGKFREPFEHISYPQFSLPAPLNAVRRKSKESDSDESFFCKGIPEDGDSVRVYTGQDEAQLTRTEHSFQPRERHLGNAGYNFSAKQKSLLPRNDLSKVEHEKAQLAREINHMFPSRPSERSQSPGNHIWETTRLGSCKFCNKVVSAKGRGICKQCENTFDRIQSTEINNSRRLSGGSWIDENPVSPNLQMSQLYVSDQQTPNHQNIQPIAHPLPQRHNSHRVLEYDDSSSSSSDKYAFLGWQNVQRKAQSKSREEGGSWSASVPGSEEHSQSRNLAGPSHSNGLERNTEFYNFYNDILREKV